MASVTIHKSGGNGKGGRDIAHQIAAGSGRRRVPITGKGRQVDEASLEQVQEVLGEQPMRHDLLIEHLHLLQERFHGLYARHLVALADLMKLPLAAVFETASFYAHFDIILDDEPEPAEVTVRVCESLTCEMSGGRELLRALEEKADGRRVRVVPAPCVGRCAVAPVAEVGHHFIDHATQEHVMEAVENGRIEPELPDYRGLEAYREDGGYELLAACRRGEHTAEEIIEALKESGLRGMGGAGFAAGLKWEITRKQRHPRLIAINGDEGEPGTFKDRFCLETDPHRFLEGTLIAAWACEITDCYIYMRDEYPAATEILKREIARLADADLLAGANMIIRRGAGAYICGEESAMLESIEGKRGYPRHKPPFPTEVGAFSLPTLAHNVETVYWVRDIVEKGAQWFAEEGRHGRKGRRAFSVSGRVKNPGVKLAPAGITIKELIEEYCGGMADGHTFKGYLPGGASGGILPASMDDIPLDFDTLQPHGCFIGSAAIIVISQADPIRDVTLNLMRFFRDESCGQCTPCRNGTEKAVMLLEQDAWDVPLLEELSRCMMDSSICGLGQAAPNPLLCAIKYFGDEIAASTRPAGTA